MRRLAAAGASVGVGVMRPSVFWFFILAQQFFSPAAFPRGPEGAVTRVTFPTFLIIQSCSVSTFPVMIPMGRILIFALLAIWKKSHFPIRDDFEYTYSYEYVTFRRFPPNSRRVLVMKHS